MKILAVDAGRGTQDILVYDTEEEPENSIQMILPARTVLLARSIDEATKRGERVVLRGVTMGGGPITKAARRHVESGGELLATPAAAATFSDDPAEVEAMGVRLIGEDEARKASSARRTILLETADVDLGALRASLGAWGLETGFDRAAVSAQDHGAAPPGMSDRRFRFGFLRESLGREASLPRQCFAAGEIPERFTRLRGVARSLREMETVLVMDTGFAALLGACLDPLVAPARTKLLVNAGNGHTLAALVEGLEVRALFEHHTRRLSPEKFAAMVEALVRGEVEDDAVFADGGHGAYRGPGDYPGGRGVDIRAITGPRRKGFVSALPAFHQTAPFGSMMATGCYGLIAAFFRRFPGEAGGAGALAPWEAERP